MTALATDSLWHRSRNGLGLLAGSPPTWWSVTPAGATILDALEEGAPLCDGHSPLTDRLLAGGAVHPQEVMPIDTAAITVVIPVLAANDAVHDSLSRLLASLSPLRVVVVDDGSPRPVEVDGVTIIRRESPAGPGPARNAGLEQVNTEFVAFVDADTHVSPDDIRRLAGHLADPRVALVAPRIAPADNSRLSWYDSGASPLDLGDSPALVRPFSRVSYVPSAVVACRVSDVRSVGCFDDSMRWGEDVDLVWRLNDAGRWCRYDPTVVARHDVRATLRALLEQRFRYGSSAGPLAARHRGTVAPFRAGVSLSATAFMSLAGWWLPAVAVGLATGAWYVATLMRRGLMIRGAVAVASMTVARSVHQGCVATLRAWWPLVLVAAMFTWRGVHALVIAAVVTLIVDVVRARPSPMRVLPWVALRLVDHLAYSLGVWRGAVATRSVRCLLPVVSVPRRSAR
ncbi:MAG: hypothetical protein RLY50_1041 [Actinomycetota bacterium]